MTIRAVVVALVAAALPPVLLTERPAAAIADCTISSDSGTADGVGDFYPATSPWSDGVKVRFRILRPTGGANCVSKPGTGWPLVVYLHGWSGNRCYNMPFVSRAELAKAGYAVLSFTARGKPASGLVGNNPPGVTGCTGATDGVDALDDNGTDFGGTRDRQDISQLIDWVRDNYAPTGCTAPCVDTNNVGVTGFSFGGYRTWWMGVPSPANSVFDSRVKAIAPFAGGPNWKNIENLSSDGAGNLRQPAWPNPLYWQNQGWDSHGEREILTHSAAITRWAYLTPTAPPPEPAETWWRSRLLVDDDPTVDKVSLINLPVFVMAGWLDGHAGVNNAVALEAYNKLTTANKYLYMGSCAHAPDPCHAPNATKMREALIRFLDLHVAGRGGTVGGPVFYTVPPPHLGSSNNPFTPAGQTWAEKTSTTWPPSGSTTTVYKLRNDGTLSTDAETIANSSKTITNLLDANYPVSTSGCFELTYDPAAGEVQPYDTPAMPGEKKLIKLEADLWVSTSTTRVQVYVDLFDVDANNIEVRIWQGTAQVAPTLRNAPVNTPQRFVFLPAGAAWTVAQGHKLRVKVASKFRKGMAPEPLPGTYTIHHNPTYQSKVTMTWAPTP